MTSPQHRIFVSHNHLDNEFGTRLTLDLRRVLGVESAVFYDVLGGLHGGETWWEKIVEELTARDVFIIVLSPDAMNSIWVRREINVALNENKYIIPVLHRPCTIRADLKILQIISFLAPQRYEVAFQEVLSALGLPPEIPVVHTESADQITGAATTWLRQIEAAFAAQDWSDVIRKADYLIKRFPDSATATIYRFQGLAYLEEGEEQHALEALETALVLVSDRELRVTLLSDYTALLARQQQWAKVLKRAREALRLVPNDPGWLATQQQAQMELLGKNSTTPNSQGEVQTREQRPSLPLQKTKEQWLEEGNVRYNAQQYTEAIADYDQAISLDPKYVWAIENRGNVYKALKDYQKAIADYDQAISLDPKKATAYSNRGLAYKALKEYQKALADYEQAISLDPKFATVYYNRGNVYYGLKEYQKALADYEQAISLDPKDVWAIENRGNVYYGLKDYQKALADYDQAISLDPKKATAYSNRGNVYYGLKDYQKALADYEQAIILDPKLAIAYNNRGLALDRIGKKNEAQQAYDKAKQLGYSG